VWLVLLVTASAAGAHGQDGEAGFAIDLPAVLRGVAGSALRTPAWFQAG
jgi:hypothetical protein